MVPSVTFCFNRGTGCGRIHRDVEALGVKDWR